jgi:hypothetical protein
VPAITEANQIANGAKLNDAGVLDAELAFTQQTVAAPTLTVPDFAGVSDSFAFVTLAQTLTNKTLTAPDINGGTADSLTSLSMRSSGAAFDLEFDTAEVLTGAKKVTWNVGDTDRTVTLGGNIALGGTLTTLGSWTHTGAHTLGITTTNNTSVTLPTTGTLATLDGSETLTQKVLTSPDINGGTADALTSLSMRSSGAAFDLEFDTAEVLTANKKVTWNVGDTDRTVTLGGNVALGGTLTTLGAWTQTGAHTIGVTTTGATTVTLPTTGTLATLDGAEALTNKTIDCSSNTVSNITEAELGAAPAAMATGIAVPFIVKADIKNALETTIYNANFPVKARLIKAWVEETDGGNSGNVSVTDGANTICAAEAYAGVDTTIVDFTTIDDAFATLSVNDTLKAVNSVNTDDANIFLMFIPIV